jgi:crossover junction endodeoxyribonuclease RuvC
MRGGESRAAPMRVLGVDPGTAVTGWGVVERRDGTVVHLAHGGLSIAPRQSLVAKLSAIHAVLLDLCRHWRPDVLALEQSFVGRNVQSAFRLGEVRGVAMLVASASGIPVAEYAPATIKLAVTGTGRGEKEQVQRAIMQELRLTEAMTPDAADALAVALCHVHTSHLQTLLADAVAPGRRLRSRPSRILQVVR